MQRNTMPYILNNVFIIGLVQLHAVSKQSINTSSCGSFWQPVKKKQLKIYYRIEISYTVGNYFEIVRVKKT